MRVMTAKTAAGGWFDPSMHFQKSRRVLLMTTRAGILQAFFAHYRMIRRVRIMARSAALDGRRMTDPALPVSGNIFMTPDT